MVLVMSEGPRERLMSMGPSGMSDLEILTILLAPGTGNQSGGMLAMKVLERFGSIDGLRDRRPGELAALSGLGAAKACRLVAAAEMGRRVMTRSSGCTVLRTAADVSSRCADLSWEGDEVFVAISLNSRNRVKGHWVIARGWESGVNLTTRQVFTILAKEAATRVVFVHNHPSGDPSPSPEDIRFTAALIQAGRTLGIRVLDHVIVASDGFASMRENDVGGLDFRQ